MKGDFPLTNKKIDSKIFNIGVTGLDHSHIHGMTQGLVDAGATLKYVHDADVEKIQTFQKHFPNTEVAESLEQILEDDSIHLVAAAAIPNVRSELGNRVMQAGKDYFTDKTGFTTLEQLAETRQVVEETGQKYFVYFNERVNIESAIYAGELIQEGKIGEVLQVTGFGPHRLRKEKRPDWFFNREQYGGILADIGVHQIEQFLFYTGNKKAEILHSKVGNYANPDTPELEDYGDATLLGENGATGFFKVHWFTPDGLPTWGDGRIFITGTKGSIEIRKYLNIGAEETGDHLFLVTQTGVEHYQLTGKVGLSFYKELIFDCIHRTEQAMTQEHIFTAHELSLTAQKDALRIKSTPVTD